MLQNSAKFMLCGCQKPQTKTGPHLRPHGKMQFQGPNTSTNSHFLGFPPLHYRTASLNMCLVAHDQCTRVCHILPRPKLTHQGLFMNVTLGLQTTMRLPLCASTSWNWGPFFFSGGASAYAAVSKEVPFDRNYVDHRNGEYPKQRRLRGKEYTVHTNTIDGCWGIVKGKFQARGGVYGDNVWENLKEYQWSRNIRGGKSHFILM